ncbi:MAG: cation diffusion facilitator family transporter, partial [Candidatus Heimdallarchaeota archaeon]|nr:cation diffusion facilitator family transporter [Candidatus Heimdallarchaeota archaeon]
MSKQNTPDEESVTKYSLGLVFTVFAIKIITVFFTTSLSYLVEVSDATFDIIMVLITWMALKASRKPADNDHMFGHYKVNSMAGLLQPILIVALYTGLLYTSIQRLVQILVFKQPYTVENGLVGAVSLGIIVLFVFFISRKIVDIGKKTQNQVIIAQGLNFRGDFYRNISVIVGLILSAFGFTFVDLIIAGIFSVIVIYQGIGVFRQSFNELIDANVITDDILETIKKQIVLISGVDAIEAFALKTAGKTLDANIILRLKFVSSQYFSNLISDQVRGIICDHCETYQCQIFIQYTFKGKELDGKEGKRKFSGHLRELIRTSDLSSDIHSIEITRVESNLIVHFHLRVDANLTLQEAHRLTSETEQNISRLVKQEIPPNFGLQVFSHIEPMEGSSSLSVKPLEITEISQFQEVLEK